MQYLDSGQIVPDPSQNFMSYSMTMELLNKEEGFDPYIMSSNVSAASIIGASSVSILSQGR
jgi:hypothetical protein